MLALLVFARVASSVAQQPSPPNGAVPDSSVVGVVRTADHGRPIAHAVVELEALGRRTSTDAAGEFRFLGVPPGKWTIRASAFGYAPLVTQVDVSGDSSTSLEFRLEPRAIALTGVEVRGERPASPLVAGIGSPTTRLEPRVVTALPAIAEADVLQAIRFLPAVQSASDFSSAPYVRGGSSDQNLFLLDGVALFNPYHLGGVFGAIDPDVVESVDVLPGGFPARAGDRLSSVVDIRTRDGNRAEVSGSGGLGLVSTRASLDGPLPGSRGAFLVSARRTYLDLVTDVAHSLRLLDSTLPYAFSDAYLKLDHDVGSRSRFTASVYLNDETFRMPRELGFRGTTDFGWGSRAASASLDSWLTPELFSEIRLGVSTFGGIFDAREYASAPTGQSDLLRSVLDARSSMRDYQLSADLTWTQGRHQLRGGVEANAYLLDHDITTDPYEFEGYIPNLRRRDALAAVAAHIEDSWTLTEAWRVRAGARLLTVEDRGTVWLPRLGLEWAITPELELSGAMSRTAQALHSLRNEASVAASFLAYDFLAALPPSLGLSTGWDAAVGAAWTTASTRVRIDAYGKRLDGLLLPPRSALHPTSPVLIADSLRTGRGTAKGVETAVQHKIRGAEFMLAYALTAARMDADTMRYTPRYVRRHTLDATAMLPLGKEGRFTTRVALASGQPYTPVINQLPGYRYDPEKQTLTETGTGHGPFVMGRYNSETLPGYVRVDLGVRKSFTRNWWGRSITFSPYLQVLNLLNSANVVATIPDDPGWGDGSLAYVPQLPVIPSFGVEWRF